MKGRNNMNSKCMNCAIYKKMLEENEPCTCAWFMDNVVFGNKTVHDCDCYKPIN